MGDTSIALSQIADDGLFVEVKQDYAKDMVAGFIRLNGATVGAVANRTEVYNADGEVAEKFEAVLSVSIRSTICIIDSSLWVASPSIST